MTSCPVDFNEAILCICMTGEADMLATVIHDSFEEELHFNEATDDYSLKQILLVEQHHIVNGSILHNTIRTLAKVVIPSRDDHIKANQSFKFHGHSEEAVEGEYPRFIASDYAPVDPWQAAQFPGIHQEFMDANDAKLFVKNMRETTLAFIQGFLGREHESLLLLFFLLQSIEHKNDGISRACLKFNLNFVDISPQSLEQFLDAILPVQPLSISLDSLESANLFSSINKENSFDMDNGHSAGEFLVGHLQRASGTILILNEEMLKEGKLGPAATRQMNCLYEVASNQRLLFDFGYDLFLECHYPVISVSKKSKSIFPMEFCIKPLSVPAFDRTLAAQQGCSNIKKYFACCRMLQRNLAISSDMAAEFEHEFVRLRKLDKIKPNDFSLLILLAKSAAISNGDTNVSSAHLREALDLHSKLIHEI